MLVVMGAMLARVQCEPAPHVVELLLILFALLQTVNLKTIAPSSFFGKNHNKGTLINQIFKGHIGQMSGT